MKRKSSSRPTGEPSQHGVEGVNRPTGLGRSRHAPASFGPAGGGKRTPDGKEVAMYVGLGTVLLIILIIILLIWIF